MNKEEIRQFKSLLKQGSLRHMNIILDDKFQKSLLEIIKDYEEKDKQIDQLTNNRNELEEWLKIKYKEYSKNKKNHIDVAMSGTFYAVLDKMNEIKEGNNEG